MPAARATEVHTARDLALRRGLRAAIALPGLLALVEWATGNELMALFAAFAGFALVAMADFGGPPKARALAYLVATAIGAVLIALGTLVSDEPIAAGLTMFVVAFVIMQVAAFGGAWSSGMFATMLAFVLAVTIPAPASEIPERLAGWGIGGIAALALALLFFPVYERPALWRAAADALRACGTYIREAGAAAARQAATTAVTALRSAYASAPYRPAGPTARDRAFIALVEGCERLVAVPPGSGGPLGEESARLREATADLLDATAECVRDDRAPEPDLHALDALRHEHRKAMGTWTSEALRGGTPAAEVLSGLEKSWWSRVMSFSAISLAADAVIARGRKALDDDIAAALQTPVDTDAWARLRRVLRLNLDLGSVRFRNALRTAVGLAIAVSIAALASVDHGFWVGLATLSVLRSNALATGRTALQAIGGTTLGFLVVLVFFGIFDAGETAEWIVMPFAAFLAAYAPSAISFLVGQLSFTVAVVMLFDVIEPEGWRTGLVRIEDIAIGAGVSLLVGLLVWPRGAIGMLRRVIGAHLRADADYLDASVSLLADVDGADATECRSHCADASRLVGDVYDELLAAPGSLPPGHEVWGAIAGSARRVHAAADLIVVQHQLGFEIAPFPDASALLQRETDELGDALRSEADALEAATEPPAIPPEPAADRHRRELAALESWGGRDPALVQAAVGVVWLSEVLHTTDLAVRAAGASIAAVAPDDQA